MSSRGGLGQYLNLRALRVASLVLRNRSLTMPHRFVESIEHVDWRELHDDGFRCVVFDKDNTLTAPYEDEVHAPLKRSFEECKEVFGREAVLFSNSAGSPDDANFEEAV